MPGGGYSGRVYGWGMLMRVIGAILLLAFTCLGVAAARAAAAGSEVVPDGKLPQVATPLAYILDITADPRADRFEGRARIRVRLEQAATRVWLHAQRIDVHQLVASDANGRALKATVQLHGDTGVLEVRFAARVPAQEILLDFRYGAAFNAELQGLYKVRLGDDAYAMTQMEPVSARYAFPAFDEPRFKTPFDISLTVPVADVAVANTRQTGQTKSPDGQWKTLSFATTRPLPTYLVAFAIGPWDVVEAQPIAPNAVRKAPLPLRGIAARGNGAKLDWALQTAAAIVPWFEDYSGQPYPFDKLDLLGAPDFSAGAMENAGLIIYRDAELLIDKQSAAERYRGVFNINAHEIAHQWYGDLVTVPWWDDLWLNEAFATWAQAKATLALHPEYDAELGALEGRQWAMASDSLLSTRKIRQPIDGRGDIETAFDGITYQKGAAVLAMVERWVGEDRFRAGMRAYLAAHAFGSGSSNDLIATLAEHAGKGAALARVMRSFLDQAGVPLVKASLDCADGKATLALAQTRHLPLGVMASTRAQWSVPVCVRFGRGDGSDAQCFLLEQAQQQFAVAGACPDWLLPNADARGYYRFELAPADFARLTAAHARLRAPEQLVLADALDAAFARGSLAPDALLDAMPAFADSGVPQVATALFPRYLWIRRQLAGASTGLALDAWVADLYDARMRGLGWRRQAGEAGTVTALRRRLAHFLATEVRQPAARAALAAQGRAALGLDGSGTVDLARADPDLLDDALKIAVQDGGAPAYAAAQRAFEASRNTAQRYALVAALGASTEPALAARARDFGLTPRVQVGEMNYLYEAQLDEPANRAAAWQWLHAHFDALRERLPPFAQAGLPARFAVGRCSMAAADELAAFFTPRIKDLIGGERGLAQTVERIRQCATLREQLDARPLDEWAAAHRPRQASH